MDTTFQTSLKTAGFLETSQSRMDFFAQIGQKVQLHTTRRFSGDEKTPWDGFPRCRGDRFGLQLIQFCHQFIPLFQIHVPIGAIQHNLIGVAEAVGNGLGGNAHVEEQGGMGVAEVVEADMRLEVVSLLCIAEIPANAAG